MKTKIKVIPWKQIIMLALFLSFTLFFFAPLEIYFSIYEDVWFDLSHVGGLILLMFVASFVCVMLGMMLVRLINSKCYEWLSALLCGGVFAAYIQGNFIISPMGSLDGATVDWNAYGKENVISVALWVIIIGACFLALMRIGFEKFWNGVKVIMICILLVQIVTLTTVCLTTEGLKPKNQAAFLDKDLFSFSKGKNVIVLVLDMYDSQVFQAICDEEGNEEYLEALDGFTYYPDTLGAYSQTYCAVPHILTGEKYLDNEPIDEYINASYSNSPLFSKLNKEEYEINIYTNEAVPTEEKVYTSINNYLPEEKSSVHVSSKRRMISYLEKLIGIRYLPQPLKQYCWFYTADFWELRDVDYDNDLYVLDNFIFDGKIEDADTEEEKNTFHFYHIEGVHAPCYYDENFNRITTNLAKEGQSGMIRNGKGMLVLVRHLLLQLKELGIYDNCAIVIMADHGGGFVEGSQSRQITRANPLLLIKGFDENHVLDYSEIPITYDYLQNAFLQLIDGKKGSELFDDVNREDGRYYITLSDFTEYVTYGHAADLSSLEATGVVYGED